IPSNIDKAAKIPIPISIGVFASFACSACLLLGRARNPIPKNLRKQKAARAPVNARTAALMDNIIMGNDSFKLKPRSSDWKVNHSLIKPLKGGKAQIESCLLYT